jgi:hypothetical protein
VTDTQTRPRQGGGSRDRRLPIVVGIVVVALLGVLGFGLTSGGGAGSSPSPAAGVVAAASPSVSVEASPIEDVFPDALEAALLARLPDDLAQTCVRGPYGPVQADPTFTNIAAKPIASLLCEPSVSTGASEVLVRLFHDGGLGGNTAFTTDGAVSGVISRMKIKPGDCATSKRASGRWELSGADAGAIACFIDSTTGDAILYWSYKDKAILIRGTNQRGDSGELYASFTNLARFITP